MVVLAEQNGSNAAEKVKRAVAFFEKAEQAAGAFTGNSDAEFFGFIRQQGLKF